MTASDLINIFLRLEMGGKASESELAFDSGADGQTPFSITGIHLDEDGDLQIIRSNELLMCLGQYSPDVVLHFESGNMCSHLQKKLFEPDGVYYPIWLAMKVDDEVTAVVRSRQLHIYRNGKKILVLAGKAQPKIISEDKITSLLTIR